MIPALAAISRYKNVQVTTCTPGQLLIMLYDGLFRFLSEGRAAIEAKDTGRAGERINRAHAILEHLLTSLDRSAHPALCDQLEPLYYFCMQHLISANIKQSAEMIDEVVRVLTPLRDAWKTAVAQVAVESVAAAKASK
jgi:flagellar protein FliS